MQILPEWLWIIIIGVVLVGLIGALWGQRNKGYLKTDVHIGLCDKVREEVCMDINKITENFNRAFATHSTNIQLLLNTKFENLDEKIENKVFKELRSIRNGNGRSKPRINRKKR